MVISEVTSVVDTIEHLAESQSQARLSPIEMRAKIAAASAQRAESIVKELKAYRQLVDMGALSEESYKKHEAALIDALENDPLDPFDDGADLAEMRERFQAVSRETWRSWTPVQRQHYVRTGEMPEEKPEPASKADDASDSEDE